MSASYIPEKKARVHLTLEVPHAPLIAFKRALFKNGISIQEFVAHIMRQTEFNSELVKGLIETAIKGKLSESNKERVHTNANAIYNILESESPFKEEESLVDDGIKIEVIE